MTNCHACDAELELVFDHPQANPTQLENALWINFDGGYGMFIESEWITKTEYTLVICHNCAHKMCALVPWIRKLLDPEHSHTHAEEFRKAHPVHYGPDYE